MGSSRSALTAPPPGLSTAWYTAAARRRTWFLLGGVALVSVLFAALTLALQFVSVVVLLTWIVLGAIAWQPRVGLFMVFGLALLLEQSSPDQLMVLGDYLHGDLSTSIGLTGVILSPDELLLLLTFGFWLGRSIATRRPDFTGGQLGWPMLLFLGALVIGFVRGVAGGGPLNVALWESRFIFYTVMCYFLATNTIRTRRHLRMLTTIFIVATASFAIEGAYRRMALIDTGQIVHIPEFWYAHEDVIFLGSLILFSLAQMIYGGPRWQRWR
jgi:hypothetical protein